MRTAIMRIYNPTPATSPFCVGCTSALMGGVNYGWLLIDSWRVNHSLNDSPCLFLGHASVVVFLLIKATVAMVANPPHIKDSLKGVIASPVVGKDTGPGPVFLFPLAALGRLRGPYSHFFGSLPTQLTSIRANQLPSLDSLKHYLVSVYLFTVILPIKIITCYSFHYLSSSGLLRSSFISPLTHIFSRRRMTSLKGTHPARSFAASIKLACTRIVNDPIFSVPFFLVILGIVPFSIKCVNIGKTLLTRLACRAIIPVSISALLSNLSVKGYRCQAYEQNRRNQPSQ